MSGPTFTAIDFETANSSRSSACAVGIVIIQDGEAVDGVRQLLRPEPLVFDPFNVAIHGITAADVLDAPRFGEYFPELLSYVRGPLVAHNASFDLSVIRHSLDQARIPYPEIDYFCTRVISGIVWPGYPTYALDYVAAQLDIKFNHHDPCDDAGACAMIAISACLSVGVNSLYELSDYLPGFRIGCLYDGGYRTCGAPRQASTIVDLETEKELAELLGWESPGNDPTKPFARLGFVFTGTMSAMQRKDAVQAVVDRGGNCPKTVTLGTHYLVVGQKGYHGYRDGFKSNKMKRAEGLLADGWPIEIISEDEFMRML